MESNLNLPVYPGPMPTLKETNDLLVAGQRFAFRGLPGTQVIDAEITLRSVSITGNLAISISYPGVGLSTHSLLYSEAWALIKDGIWEPVP